MPPSMCGCDDAASGATPVRGLARRAARGAPRESAAARARRAALGGPPRARPAAAARARRRGGPPALCCSAGTSGRRRERGTAPARPQRRRRARAVPPPRNAARPPRRAPPRRPPGAPWSLPTCGRAVHRPSGAREPAGRGLTRGPGGLRLVVPGGGGGRWLVRGRRTAGQPWPRPARAAPAPQIVVCRNPPRP
jgi:hypothetical protein